MDSLPYTYIGDLQLARKEYEDFQRCLPQLIDESEITGDLEGRWIIFRDGWVYGLASYNTRVEAIQFGGQMHHDEPEATWLVVQVDLNKHMLSALHLLGDVLRGIDDKEAT